MVVRRAAITTAAFLAGVLLTLAISMSLSKTEATVARPALCDFAPDHPFWSAVTYMNQDNAALRLQAERTDDVDRHLRGTPGVYAEASRNYDVLLGYVAREVYACGFESVPAAD